MSSNINEEAATAVASTAPVASAAPAPRKTYESSTISLMWNASKKMAIIGAVYFLGWMNWSVAWLIAPFILSVIRDEWKKEKTLQRDIAKMAALTDEQDVVLARLGDLPAWVFFPDVDRAEWLNRIIKQLWPNVNHYTRELIKTVIEPNISVALQKYNMYGFRFDRLILGTIPPRIGGVKVYDKNVGRNEIIMDVDLTYAGNCDITFYLKGVKGGIKDFQIKGMIRVVMTPLITQIPLVGGLQIFFLNNPDIDFDLVGIADILDIPGLSDMLRKVIVEQVASMMVLPNKFPIKLSDAIDLYTLKMPEPEGVLRVHVVEAKNLMKKDIGMLGKGKSDPYAVINIGSQEFRTKAIDNTVNPKWDYWFEALINSRKGQILAIELWDWDPGVVGVNKDDFLGRATVEIAPVVEKGQIDKWITLEQVKHGMVHLRLTWLITTDDISCLQQTIRETHELRVTDLSTALLTVYVDSARNLPQAREKSKPDTYVTLSVGKHTHQTNVVMRADCPVWEYGCSFLVSNPETDTLTAKVIDQKTGSEVGHLIYNLSGLLKKDGLQEIQQPFHLKNSGAESKLIMSLKLKILKHPEIIVEDIGGVPKLTHTDSTISSASVTTLPPSTPNRQFDNIRKQDSVRSAPGQLILDEESEEKTGLPPYEEAIEEHFEEKLESSYESAPTPDLRQRRRPSVSEVGEEGLGRIQLTIRYSVQRQKLIVVVHKIKNLPLKDPSSIPDPYVKLYLLPERSKDTKRKTNVIKDNCNPIFDETFEYTLSQGELKNKQLEVTVVTQKGIFSSGSNVMGQVIIDLGKSDFTQALTDWFDLYAEYSQRD